MACPCTPEIKRDGQSINAVTKMMKRVCLITGIALSILCAGGWSQTQSNAVKVTHEDFSKVWPMNSINIWNVELDVLLNPEVDLEKKLGGGMVLTLQNRTTQELHFVRDLRRRSIFGLVVKDRQGTVVPFTEYGTNFFVRLPYPESQPLARLARDSYSGPRQFSFGPGQVLREVYGLPDIVALKPGRYFLTVSANIIGPYGRLKLTLPDIPFVVKPTDFTEPATKPPEEPPKPQPQ